MNGNPAPSTTKLNPFTCLLHPFDGFHAVKEEGKGSRAAVIAILAVFFLATVFQRQNTGYTFNYADLSDLNIWLIAAKTIVLFALWVGGNWAVATWMDGEGKFMQITVVSAYAIIPYVAAVILSTLLSNVLVQEEGMFLGYLRMIALIWSAILMLIGLLIIHDYGMPKTLQSIAFTFAAMGIVVFLATLFYTLLQQVYVFLYTIYNELLFRL